MNNKIYYIYHIPGKKIGVSTNLKKRIQRQGYTMEEVEVLEEHTDIHRVSLREQELQKEYEYKVDCIPYWRTLKNQTKEGRSKGGKIGGKIVGKISGKRNVESGQLAKALELSNIARRTPISQYTKDGNFIKEFMSQREAAKELNLNYRNINKVLKGRGKTAGGFVFRYVTELAC